MKWKWISVISAILVLTGIGVMYLLQPVASANITGSQPIVFQDKEILIYFSQPIRENTLSDESVVLKKRNGDPVPMSYSLSEDRLQLTIAAPENGYEANETYTLHVDDSIRSTLGLSLRHDTDLRFTAVDELVPVTSAEEIAAFYAALPESSRTEVQEDSSMAGSADQAFSESEGNFSETNNQVEGVSESDMVVTDGTHIYRIRNGEQVEILLANPASSMKTVATIPAEPDFWPRELFLYEGTLIVLGDQYSYTDDTYSGFSMVKIYSVENPASPQLVRETGTEGSLITARMVDQYLYFTSSYGPQYWLMEEQNADAELLQPKMLDSASAAEPVAIPLSDIRILPQPSSEQYTTIAVVDVKDPTAEMSVESFLGSSGQLYMNKEHLYLAETPSFMATPFSADIATTSMPVSPGGPTTIYKFAFNQMDVTPVAHADVAGTVLNQFSMDEHNGYFRVATTEGNVWDDTKPSKNHLFILDEALNPVGSVEGLAPGERIYSARFMGDKAYMVTFRETDPLYVIDVADPANPAVLGELKIPGFSSYLHPLDDTHLIGVGMQTELQKSDVPGQDPLVIQDGVKVSLFDISDFSNPVEQDTAVIGGLGTYSPVLHDHRAFFAHEERSLYGFPVTIYDTINDQDYSFINQGAVLFSITPENGIETAAELFKKPAPGQLYEDWENEVQRMIYIENTLYTVSNRTVNAYDLTSFQQLN